MTTHVAQDPATPELKVISPVSPSIEAGVEEDPLGNGLFQLYPETKLTELLAGLEEKVEASHGYDQL